MTSSFEENIQAISQKVHIRDEDRAIYTKDFENIREHILSLMKRNVAFKRIFGGTSLFGSYLDGIKVGDPDEFDVHFKLTLPHHEMIAIEKDPARPGFVRLNFGAVLNTMQQNPCDTEVYELFKNFVDEQKYLLRNPLRNWLHKLLETGLDGFRVVFGSYKLSYSKGGTAYTIHAESNERKIKIDLVPAFEFDRPADWMAKKIFPSNEKPLWFAVPKPTVGFEKTSSFSICAPQLEKELVSKKDNLKNSLRLLKALTIRDDMFRLKSYFIKTVFLWECERKQGAGFWQKPTGELFLFMLDRLVDCFKAGKIPFYWDERQNLLDALDSDEIRKYKEYLMEEYKLLSGYAHQPQISFETLEKRFRHY